MTSLAIQGNNVTSKQEYNNLLLMWVLCLLSNYPFKDETSLEKARGGCGENT